MQKMRALLQHIISHSRGYGHHGELRLNDVTDDLRAACNEAAVQALSTLDEIEAAQPRWTSEPPTEEGFYVLSWPGARQFISAVHVTTDMAAEPHGALLNGLVWFRIPAPPTREESTP